MVLKQRKANGRLNSIETPETPRTTRAAKRLRVDEDFHKSAERILANNCKQRPGESFRTFAMRLKNCLSLCKLLNKDSLLHFFMNGIQAETTNDEEILSLRMKLKLKDQEMANIKECLFISGLCDKLQSREQDLANKCF